MKYREVNLVGGFYRDASLPWSSQDCVNWLPAGDDSGQARSEMMLRGAPGIREVTFEVTEGGGGGGIVVSPLRIFGNAFDVAKDSTYSYTYSVLGGTGPYVITLFSGVLPPGLSLNPATGVVSGTASFTGTYSFTVRASDAAGLTADLADTITVFTAEPSGPVPTLQPAVLVNPGFESGNTGWTPNTAARIASGAPIVSPGYVITNEAGRTGSWVMRWTGSPSGRQDTCFNAKVANTFAQAGVNYSGQAWIRCTAFSGSGVIQAAVLMEKFSDAACTNPAGSAVSSFLTFTGVNATWTNVITFIPSGQYIRLSLIVTQGIDIPVTATIEFDDVTWNVEEIAP